MAGYIRWFDEIGLGDIALVGGKNASLGELHGGLRAAGVRVPDGFAVTADAYRAALAEAGAWPALHRLLDGLDVTDVAQLAERAAKARRVVYEATGGAALAAEIGAAYRRLRASCGEALTLAADWTTPWAELALGGDLRLVSDSFDDAGNFVPIDGHALTTLRASIPLGRKLEVYGRLENLADVRHETAAGYGSAGRSGFAGARVRF